MSSVASCSDGAGVITRVFAIVPAAGRSRRMGTPKQLVDIEGRPMLLAVLEPLLASRVKGLAVVTHQAIIDALPQLQDPRILVVRNDDESSEMIDSVRLALAAWEARMAIAATDGFLVCPGDHPCVSPEDIEACLTAFAAAPSRIVIATRAGRHGHPMIFPAALLSFVRSAGCNGGLNNLAHSHHELVLKVECESPGVTRDIDTPGDTDGERDRPS